MHDTNHTVLFESLEPRLLMSTAVDLVVPEVSGTTRLGEPVTSGVPLPQGAVVSTAHLRLLHDGSEIPAQFKVLSRWDGTPDDQTKSIKWVLLDFQADVAANGSAAYALEYGSDVTHGFYGPDLLTDAGPSWHFDSGTLAFDVSRSAFQLFNNLTVNGTPVVTDAVNNGVVIAEDGTGKVYTSVLGPPLEIEVEENGPMKAVLHMQGGLEDADGEYLGRPATDKPRLWQPYPYVNYNARITVYKDKDYAKVLFIIENNGCSGVWPESKYAAPQNVYINSLQLQTQLVDFGPDPQIHTVTADYATGGGEMRLATRGQFTDGPDTFPYSLTLGGATAESGTKYPGWVEISDTLGRMNVAVGMKYFWQKHPADLAFSGNVLSVEPMPAGQGYPLGTTRYDLDGGRHYSSEVLYRFSLGTRDAAATAGAMRFLADPLFAYASSSYYASTGAWTDLAPADVQVTDPLLQDAIDRYEKQVLAQVDLSQAEGSGGRPPSTVSSYRGDNSKWFGSLNFGDIRWANSYSSLHYDWTQGMFLNMLRTGNPLFYQQAQEFLPHRRDVDQYWGDRRDLVGGEQIWINNLSRYESDNHNEPSAATGYGPNPTPKPSHNWNGGLVLGYLLTGDEEALEAAQEHYKFAMNWYQSRLTTRTFGGSELRNQGWTIVGLLNLYRALGRQEYLDLALAIGKNDLLYGEQLAGGKGVWEGPEASPVPGYTVNQTQMENTMYMYVAEALVDLYQESRDADIGQLIVRMAQFAKTKDFYGGDYNLAGNYRPLQSDYTYRGPDTRGSGDTLRGFFFSNLAATAFQITGDPSYMDFARRLFEDATFYYEYAGPDYINPSRRDPATFADDMYNSTWSKAKGWLLRAHQVYLRTEEALLPPPQVTAIELNGRVDRGASAIEPSGVGVREIEVHFSRPVFFGSDDVTLQTVSFPNGVETAGATLRHVTVTGSGSDTMAIALGAEGVRDTWVKVTLRGDGTLRDVVRQTLDGEPRSAGSGLGYIFSSPVDLPTGDGSPGGNAVFYVGSLRGDFNGDGAVTAADKAGFLAAWNAKSLDADFRGVGFGVRPPDGKIMLGDIDGFTSVYLGAVAAGHHLDPLPASGGPHSAGMPGPLPMMPQATSGSESAGVDVLGMTEPVAVGPVPAAAPVANSRTVAANLAVALLREGGVTGLDTTWAIGVSGTQAMPAEVASALDVRQPQEAETVFKKLGKRVLRLLAAGITVRSL